MKTCDILYKHDADTKRDKDYTHKQHTQLANFTNRDVMINWGSFYQSKDCGMSGNPFI